MVLNRDRAKRALQNLGLFPAVRTVYRSLNPSIRIQQSHEVAFYRAILKPNSLCFDVGANLGQKAEVFRLCGARVIAIEPNSLCHPTLRYLFNRDPNVEILATAIGSSIGSMRPPRSLARILRGAFGRNGIGRYTA